MGFRSTTALLLAISSTASGQGVLERGDVGVVTSDGFYLVAAWPSQSAPTHHLGPAAFGLTSLAKSGITWEYGRPSFLICTGNQLFRVIVDGEGATVTDVSPAVSPSADLVDLDLHPGNGSLVVLDRFNDQALLFQPPFALGMTPTLVLPVSDRAKAVCVDSRQYPEAIIYNSLGEVVRHTLDGATSPVAFFAGADALDDHPQAMFSTFIVDRQDHRVVVSLSNPSLVIELNLLQDCAPVALSPNAVVHDPISTLTYVLALDGVNPDCLGGTLGPNHVVALGPTIGPVLPTVITNPADSGISGTDGALALVTGDFAFVYPYGPLCTATGGTKPFLWIGSLAVPVPGTPVFIVHLADAQPSRPVLLLVGPAPFDQPVMSGCTLLVQPTAALSMGATDAEGSLNMAGPVPPRVPIGTNIFVQAAILSTTETVLTQGLMLHVGLN